MLRSVREMTGYTVQATDGEIGRVMDFYFDDEQWAVRYVAVDPGMSASPVLISPMAVTNPDFDGKRFDVALTADQVRNSPALAAAADVSRAWEEQYATYYRYPAYWGGTLLWGNFATAVDAAAAALAGFPLTPAQTGAAAEDHAPAGTGATNERTGATGTASAENAPVGGETHVHSFSRLRGCLVMASDGSTGTVEDLLVDDRTWQVLHLVVDTTRFWPGGEVVVPADQVQGVDWTAQTVTFGLTREEIKRRAEFRPAGASRGGSGETGGRLEA